MAKEERTLFRKVLSKIKSKFDTSKTKMLAIISQIHHLDADILVDQLRKAVGLIRLITDEIGEISACAHPDKVPQYAKKSMGNLHGPKNEVEKA